VGADAKRAAHSGMSPPPDTAGRGQRPEVCAAVTGRRLGVDGIEVDRPVPADCKVADVETLQLDRTPRPRRLAGLPDEQPVTEDVEQPDRAVPGYVEQHRPLRSVQAPAAAFFLEADRRRAGVRDDGIRAP